MTITSNLKNSIWPNGVDVDSDGYAMFYPLGTNKVDIPKKGSEWPKGNKLISPFVYQDDKLVGFCDTKAMEVGGATTIVMPYEHIEAEFSSIDKGVIQIATPKATTKKASWKNGGMEDIPEAQYKYKGCKTVNDIKAVDEFFPSYDMVGSNVYIFSELLCDLEDGKINDYTGLFTGTNNLVTFESDLTSLQNGYYMFANCANMTNFNLKSMDSLVFGGGMFLYCSGLTDFECGMSVLTNGFEMFYGCSKLTTFTSDLSSLTNGIGMFASCSNLTTFTSDLSSLTDGYRMFYFCRNLTTFTSDSSGSPVNLSSVVDGSNMFEGCEKLTAFTSDLSSLTGGFRMFYACNALTAFTSDLSSLTNGGGMFEGCLLDTVSVKNIAETIKTVTNSPSITIGISNSTPSQEEHAYLTQIHNKGWKVYVNGSHSSNIYTPATASLDETGETQTAPIPFWAKPESATEETAKYIDENGNFFNIIGAQFIYVDDPETYGMFTCEEDAAANMRLTPYVKSQAETINQN